MSKQSEELLEATFRELFQAERSGTRHPRVEAERLEKGAASSVMTEIATHADAALEQLDDLVRRRGIRPAQGAKAIGRALSAFRNQVADLTTTSEQSYRVTMLGVGHGIDLVRVLRELAVAAGDAELREWSERWLERRLGLIEQAEDALAWFVANPEKALAPARDTPLAVVARSALKAFGKADTGSAARPARDRAPGAP